MNNTIIRRWVASLVVVTVAIYTLPNVRAEVIAFDDMESRGLGALHGQSGGAGTVGYAVYKATVNASVVSQPLGYVNGEIAIDGGGNALLLAPPSLDSNLSAFSRPLGSLDGDVLYLSFLFRTPSANGSAEDYFMLGFHNGSGEPTAGVMHRLNVAKNDHAFGLRGTSSSEAKGTEGTETDQTYFIVFKLAKSVPGAASAFDSLSLFVNPSTTNEPTPTLTHSTTRFTAATHLTARVTSLEAGDSYLLDNLRVGATYWDVVKPECDVAIAPAKQGADASVAITLSSRTPGASIRYTTDGSDPSSTAGTLYTAPFTLTQTARVKAIAYKSGLVDSPVTLKDYFVGIQQWAPTSVSPGYFMTDENWVSGIAPLDGLRLGWTNEVLSAATVTLRSLTANGAAISSDALFHYAGGGMCGINNDLDNKGHKFTWTVTNRFEIGTQAGNDAHCSAAYRGYINVANPEGTAVLQVGSTVGRGKLSIRRTYGLTVDNLIAEHGENSVLELMRCDGSIGLTVTRGSSIYTAGNLDVRTTVESGSSPDQSMYLRLLGGIHRWQFDEGEGVRLTTTDSASASSPRVAHFEIAGPDTVWTNGGFAKVGCHKGSYARMLLFDGAAGVVKKDLAVSDSAGNGSRITNRVNVAGSGTVLQVDGNVYVGEDGQYARLEVVDGGRFETLGDLVLGFAETSITGNVLSVTSGGVVAVRRPAGDALLDVRRGMIAVSGGVVETDRLQLGSEAEVEVAITEPAVGSLEPIVDVAGAASLGGALRVSASGFVPNRSMTWILVGSGAFPSGRFSSETLSGFPDDFKVRYTTQGVVLSATAPGTYIVIR